MSKLEFIAQLLGLLAILLLAFAVVYGFIYWVFESHKVATIITSAMAVFSVGMTYLTTKL